MATKQNPDEPTAKSSAAGAASPAPAMTAVSVAPAPAPKSRAAAPSAATQASNLTVELFYESTSVLQPQDIQSITVNTTDPCGTASTCPQTIGQGALLQDITGRGVSFPLSVATGKALRIDLGVTFADGTTTNADPILVSAACNQLTTVSTIVAPPANEITDQGCTEVIVQGHWCACDGSTTRETQGLRFDKVSATLLLQESAAGAVAPPTKPAKPIQAIVRDDLAFFQMLTRGATYSLTATAFGGENSTCSGSGNFTVPSGSGTPKWEIGIKRAQKLFVLVFHREGQPQQPDVFLKSGKKLPVGSNGVCTGYAEESERSLQLISPDFSLSPQEIPLNSGAALTLRAIECSERSGSQQKRPGNFFELTGLLIGEEIIIQDLDGVKVGTATADASGHVRVAISAPGEARRFIRMRNGKVQEEVLLKAPGAEEAAIATI